MASAVGLLLEVAGVLGLVVEVAGVVGLLVEVAGVLRRPVKVAGVLGLLVEGAPVSRLFKGPEGSGSALSAKDPGVSSLLVSDVELSGLSTSSSSCCPPCHWVLPDAEPSRWIGDNVALPSSTAWRSLKNGKLSLCLTPCLCHSSVACPQSLCTFSSFNEVAP